MKLFLQAKSEFQRSVAFILAGLTLTIIWVLIIYYILSDIYLEFSFFFYLAIFLLGMLFRVRNSLFIPFSYLLIYGTDLICRIIIDSFNVHLNQRLFNLLIFYHIEMAILSIIKINMDAKDHGWDAKRKWQNIGIALLLPSAALVVYYIIIRQVFVFE